jgi:hypothetical protein
MLPARLIFSYLMLQTNCATADKWMTQGLEMEFQPAEAI